MHGKHVQHWPSATLTMQQGLSRADRPLRSCVEAAAASLGGESVAATFASCRTYHRWLWLGAAPAVDGARPLSCEAMPMSDLLRSGVHSNRHLAPPIRLAICGV